MTFPIRFPFALYPAQFSQVLCLGPSRNKRPTLASLRLFPSFFFEGFTSQCLFRLPCPMRGGSTADTGPLQCMTSPSPFFPAHKSLSGAQLDTRYSTCQRRTQEVLSRVLCPYMHALSKNCTVLYRPYLVVSVCTLQCLLPSPPYQEVPMGLVGFDPAQSMAGWK